MKLELKHLSPYLPYGLKVEHGGYKKTNRELLGLQKGNNSVSNELAIFKDAQGYFTGYLYECKPILRPLNVLDKEIEIDNEKFIPITKLLQGSHFNTDSMTFYEQSGYIETMTDMHCGSSYMDIQQLVEWHFDVFGLIDKGLAIDINALKQLGL